MFSRRSGKSKGKAAAPAERVFESVHLAADRCGAVLVIDVLEESVTEREAGIIYDETEALLDDRTTGLVIDLGGVMILTSAGIGTLVRLHKRIGERKGKLAVCSLSEELEELFKLTRMDKLFSVSSDRAAAVSAVSS